MSSLIVEATDHGISITPEQLQQLGVEPGQRVDIASLPNADRVTDLALRHVLNYLGEGLGVADATWNGKEWVVPVLAPGGETSVGQLYLDARGAVKAGKSLSFEALVEMVRASRSTNKTAA